MKFIGLWLMRWLVSWAEVAEGIVGVLTLGAWSPCWALAASKRLSDYRFKYWGIGPAPW